MTFMLPDLGIRLEPTEGWVEYHTIYAQSLSFHDAEGQILATWWPGNRVIWIRPDVHIKMKYE